MTGRQNQTVTYHRAEYDDTDDTWRVWFREHGGYYSFSGADGEAMGLTPPEPAPLVVTCNGHSIELSDEEVEMFTYGWERPPHDVTPYVAAAIKLARLLRDARQDPQPAADAAAWLAGERVPRPAPTGSDTLDFDAMPIGTVAEVTLLDGDRLLALKDGDGPDYKWYVGDSSSILLYHPKPGPLAHLVRASHF